MKKDIRIYMLISVIYTSILILASIDILMLIENKVLYVVVIAYLAYKVIYEMSIVYRGIYRSIKYNKSYRKYTVEEVCNFCNEKATYKKVLYEHIKGGIYNKKQKEVLTNCWGKMLDEYYDNKLYAIIFIVMNLVLVIFLGEDAYEFCAIVSMKIIFDGMKYNKEKKYLEEIEEK